MSLPDTMRSQLGWMERFIIWGGAKKLSEYQTEILSTGAIYELEGRRWSAISLKEDIPDLKKIWMGRPRAVAIGKKLFVYGCSFYLCDSFMVQSTIRRKTVGN